MIELRGMTWNHIRGYGPLAATAGAYGVDHPDVRIRWEERTLQEFADYPITRLAESYDLLIIDHPFVGAAAATGCLAPLDQYVDPATLSDQAAHSVGQSNASYIYAGHQWALAIDAAAHVGVYRPDLLERSGIEAPRTWDDVLTLAAERQRAGHGYVAIPLIPVDTLMCFYTLCANGGEGPFSDGARVVSRAVGRHALDLLRSLRAHCHPASLSWNPPMLLEEMSRGDDVLYCPLLFGYSNYARPGFRPALLRFTSIPSAGRGGPHGAILGGTGLAISSGRPHREAAYRYAAYVASADIQRTTYFDSGGQPGHRGAWLDKRINAASNDFFVDTLETLDRAYLRPRYNGYMKLQERAGLLLHAFLRDGGDVEATLDNLDRMYRASVSDALVDDAEA